MRLGGRSGSCLWRGEQDSDWWWGGLKARAGHEDDLRAAGSHGRFQAGSPTQSDLNWRIKLPRRVVLIESAARGHSGPPKDYLQSCAVPMVATGRRRHVGA